MNFSPFTAKPCASPAPSRAVKTLPLTATTLADCPSAVPAAAHRSAMMPKVTIRWRTASSASRSAAPGVQFAGEGFDKCDKTLTDRDVWNLAERRHEVNAVL